jgi:hypothetical protein
MNPLKHAQVQIAERIAVHRDHARLARQAGRIAQGAGGAKRSLLEGVEKLECAIVVAKYQWNLLSEVSNAEDGPLEAGAHQLIQQESNEGAASHISHGLGPIADDRTESTSQPARQNQGLASYRHPIVPSSDFNSSPNSGRLVVARVSNLSIIASAINEALIVDV